MASPSSSTYLPAAGRNAIFVRGLEKTYGDGTEAVRGVDLTVPSGEAFGLLGPNGAGKSTTIGVLGTLVRPTGGRAEVAGFDTVRDAAEVRRRIGFAMQQAGTDDFATAVELLALHGRLHGLGRAEAISRARHLLCRMDLEPVANRRLGALSGGLKRRVDLAASLVHEPSILFLDEPAEGLDPRSRADLWEMLGELRRELGITLVLTTHYMEEADRLCDRVGLIDRGRLVAVGTPAELKAGVDVEGRPQPSPPPPGPTLEDVYLHFTGRRFDEETVARLDGSRDELEVAA